MGVFYMSNKNSQPPISTKPTIFALSSGQNYTLSASNCAVRGSIGIETVVIPVGVMNASIDSAVENVKVSGSLFNTPMFIGSDSKLYIYQIGLGLQATISPSASGTHLLFNDGSAITFSAKSTGLTYHFDNIQLSPNASINIPNGDVAVHGSTGQESVTISAGIHNVEIDGQVEKIQLQGLSFSQAKLVSAAQQLGIYDASNQKVAQLTVNPSQTEKLVFPNASGVVTLDKSGNGIFNLTDLVLNAGQSYSVTQTGVHIYGNSGYEVVTLAGGVLNEVIDSRIEKVVLNGNYSSYTWKALSGAINFYDSQSAVVASISVPKNSLGTQIQFADGAYTATFVSGSITLTSSSGGVLASLSVTPAGSGSSTPTGNTPQFQYTLNYGNFGTNLIGIQNSLTTAFNNISKFLNAKGSLDIQVLPASLTTNILAQANGAMITTSAGKSSPEFLLESISGIDANSSQFDATVYINTNNLSKFNLDPAKKPSASQFDLTTVLTHELLHALGFTGGIGGSGGQQKSPFDNFVSTINGLPYFTGGHAQAIYGGPVPLAPASAGVGSAYYHVNVANDLMSSSVAAGQVRTVSNLDLAILQDIGAPVLIGVFST